MAESLADRRTQTQVDQARPSWAFLTSVHPSGDPGAILRIDQPANRAAHGTGDVVILSMTDAQCRNADVRQAMIEDALSALAAGGLIWVDVPGEWRSRLAAALRAAGLTIGEPTVFRARGGASAEISLTPRALRFVLHRGQVSKGWRMVSAMLRYAPWGRAALLRLLPGVGFSAFRPGSSPFGWLADRLPAGHPAEVALITNWRGERAPFLVFAIGEPETVVAKRGGRDCHEQIRHEAAMLEQLGPGLTKCGLEYPRLLGCHDGPRVYSLIESDVAGRPLAKLIGQGRYRNLDAIIGAVARWLCRWNRETVRQTELTPDLAEQLILLPARELAGEIEHGTAYLEYLSRETGRLIGHKVPLVAAHNDLTMANILADDSTIRSVVDWEAASPHGLPLADFRYAACDAAVCLGSGDRLAAFRACFVDDGETRQCVDRYEAPLKAIAKGPPEWLNLCVHACWIRHAANERARRSSRPDRDFIAIAGLLARSVAA